MSVCVYVCEGVCACVRACVRACVCTRTDGCYPSMYKCHFMVVLLLDLCDYFLVLIECTSNNIYIICHYVYILYMAMI